MITLYGAQAGFGLPQVSPYVMKTEIQLKMAGLAYIPREAMPDESPKGQIPFIDDDGARIADSTFIRLHLERAYGVDFDEALTPRQRAEAWAVERMLENQLGWVIGYFRWLTPENFERGPAHFFDDAPEGLQAELRAEVLREVRAAMRAQGVARHTDAEIVELGLRSLSALSEILGAQAYLFGDRPCGADAVAVAILAALYTPVFPCELQARAQAYGNLVAYTDRLMAAFYPEFAWEVQPEPALAA
ncbi:glutathione S-transferase family protein [Phenylobacterium sp.]|jgi:glutathione S-transferase|uniref:glutathione S-transferase family protein n=1 Tax=Phenylobacterium sp. TaxID=1871053 RepID=UPI002F92BF16